VPAESIGVPHLSRLPAEPGAGRGRVTYVGHATVLVELDGVRLLTDPMLRRRVFHLRRSPAAGVTVPEGVDAVLVSHAHWDHLDVRSLVMLPGDTPLVVPGGVRRLVRGRRGDVVELDVGGVFELDGVTVTATYAEHDAGRGPFGARTPALGFLLAGSSRIYFAGDTDLFPGMADLAPLDLALLPVAGWGPTLPPGHLNPRSAAEALRLLRPRTAVPIHWGTYAAIGWRRPARDLDRTAAEAFARHAAELAPEVDVRILAPGETLEL
jgi:L-ascorbate metabolism protein UlaG (beta-lactamase superfamily)